MYGEWLAFDEVAREQQSLVSGAGAPRVSRVSSLVPFEPYLHVSKRKNAAPESDLQSCRNMLKMGHSLSTQPRMAHASYQTSIYRPSRRPAHVQIHPARARPLRETPGLCQGGSLSPNACSLWCPLRHPCFFSHLSPSAPATHRRRDATSALSRPPQPNLDGPMWGGDTCSRHAVKTGVLMRSSSSKGRPPDLRADQA